MLKKCPNWLVKLCLALPPGIALHHNASTPGHNKDSNSSNSSVVNQEPRHEKLPVGEGASEQQLNNNTKVFAYEWRDWEERKNNNCTNTTHANIFVLFFPTGWDASPNLRSSSSKSTIKKTKKVDHKKMEK